MDLDEVAPLEVVQRVMLVKAAKCHSRSSSHDSYFERKLSAAYKSEDEDDTKGSALDLSEIQMNFELEENEMKIFSEDEAMLTNMSNSVGSDLSHLMITPLEECKPFVTPTSSTPKPKSQQKRSPKLSGDSEEEEGSHKGRMMSLKDKLKKFTSPTPNRKISLEHPGDEAEQITKKSTSLKDKIVSALSPESIRKKYSSSTSSSESPASGPKSSLSKKSLPSSSEASPGTSPSTLVKRSRIEEDAVEELPAPPAEQSPPPLSLPLSPSIGFIDASASDAGEATSNVHGKSQPK
jgi:hypothetical protein